MKDEKKNGQQEIQFEEIDEFDEESDEFDEESDELDEPEWFEPEDEPTKPWMTVLIFAGLAVLAAIICAFLWYFTHLNQQNNQVNAPNAETTQSTDVSETLASVESSSDIAATSEPTAEPSPEPTPTIEPTQTMEPTSVPTTAPENQAAEPVSGTTSMTFIAMQDMVTAKDVTNLRNAPSTEDSENVVGQLKNGESLSRIGLNDDTGWSKLEYQGQEVYAVTRYLTTDLTYKTPVAAASPNRITTQDGRVIIFVDYDDYITPKEYVNLRTEPSTSQGDTTVRCQVKNGTNLHRTGYSADSGWSRVDYNGESLYVVTNYVNGVVMEQQ